MADFSGGWLVSPSQSGNWGSSAELDDPQWPHLHVWELVPAVGGGSSVSSTQLFSPCSF